VSSWLRVAFTQIKYLLLLRNLSSKNKSVCLVRKEEDTMIGRPLTPVSVAGRRRRQRRNGLL
jgi:hypothetical protein